MEQNLTTTAPTQPPAPPADPAPMAWSRPYLHRLVTADTAAGGATLPDGGAMAWTSL